MDRRLSAIESDRYGDEELTKLATEVYRILPSSIAEIQQAVGELRSGAVHLHRQTLVYGTHFPLSGWHLQ